MRLRRKCLFRKWRDNVGDHVLVVVSDVSGVLDSCNVLRSVLEHSYCFGLHHGMVHYGLWWSVAMVLFGSSDF